MTRAQQLCFRSTFKFVLQGAPKNPKLYFVIIYRLKFTSFVLFFRSLNDLEREMIVVFKSENPTWVCNKCCAILPKFFGGITQYEFNGVLGKLKQEGEDVALKRRRGPAEFLLSMGLKFGKLLLHWKF